MSFEGLDAGASSFIPGTQQSAAAPPSQDSFRIYEEMMDTIESELEKDGGGDIVVMASSPHSLAEYWFPECRDCMCCKGFKHACECVVSGGGGGGDVGVCSKCHVVPNLPGPDTSSGAERSGETTTSDPSKGRGKVLCKFFQSPQGCRFGHQCRFAHE